MATPRISGANPFFETLVGREVSVSGSCSFVGRGEGIFLVGVARLELRRALFNAYIKLPLGLTRSAGPELYVWRSVRNPADITSPARITYYVSTSYCNV